MAISATAGYWGVLVGTLGYFRTGGTIGYLRVSRVLWGNGWFWGALGVLV